MTTLQTKNYFLRVSLEQVQAIVDGLIENEVNIDESSMDIYDSNIEDIFDQFRSQGVDIVRPALAPDEANEYQRASKLFDEIDFLLNNETDEDTELIATKVKALRTLVIG